MSDLIDREAALNCFHSWADKYGDVHTPDEMPEYRALEELPSIEQPEIIRCRECKCWRELPNGCQGFCDVHSAYPTLTDFCSWAERREVSE